MGILIFLIFDPKHRLWVLGEAVLTCTHNQCFEQVNKNTKIVSMKFSIFAFETISIYIAWASFRNMCPIFPLYLMTYVTLNALRVQ